MYGPKGVLKDKPNIMQILIDKFFLLNWNQFSWCHNNVSRFKINLFFQPMKILLKYTQHVVGDQDHHYESLDTDWKSLKWLFLNFLAIQMLSGLLKNEQMVILKTTFKKKNIDFICKDNISSPWA